MKRIVLIYGSISGTIVALMLIISCVFIFYKAGHYDPEAKGGAVVGYTSMFLAMSMIFVGVKQYKTKYMGGNISFLKAWGVGLLIASIASAFYVITWLIMYTTMFPDFINEWGTGMLKSLHDKNAPAEEIAKAESQFSFMKKMYSNLFGVALITLAEIFPMGIVMSLISAIIFSIKKKQEVEPA